MCDGAAAVVEGAVASPSRVQPVPEALAAAAVVPLSTKAAMVSQAQLTPEAEVVLPAIPPVELVEVVFLLFVMQQALSQHLVVQ